MYLDRDVGVYSCYTRTYNPTLNCAWPKSPNLIRSAPWTLECLSVAHKMSAALNHLRDFMLLNDMDDCRYIRRELLLSSQGLCHRASHKLLFQHAIELTHHFSF